MALASVKRYSREYKTLLALDADMKELQRLFNEGLDAKESDTAESETASDDFLTDEGDIKYSVRVTDKDTLDFLNNQKAVKVYRAMQEIDGKLYPPMAAKVKSLEGKNELVTPSELKVWEQASERPDLIQGGNKFKLDKANGSSIGARYNPYFHTSRSPLNDQFSSAYKRDNLVTVEGIVPVSELTSGYRAEHAKDTVGEMSWHSGPVSSKLSPGKERKVILSRWFMPIRVVPDSEVASVISNILKGENVTVPYEVVTPSLRAELKKKGVSIGEPKGSDIRYSYREDTTDNTADPNDSINDNAFNSQLEQWLKGEHKGEYFELGNTPEILKKHGAKNLPIIMSEQVLVKITGEKHAISIDNIATLPQQIRKPILLFKGSIDNSFVVVTEMKDKSGNEVVCAIHLNKYQQRFRVNRIASLYGKKNIVDYVLSNIDNGNLLDADIRKAPVWFTNRGLQLPKLVQTITDAKQTVSQNSDAVKGIIRNNSQGDTHKFSENEKSSYREFKGTPEQASREQLEKTLAVLEKQLKLTAGSELDRKAVRRYAKKLKQSYSAAMDIDKLTDKILRSTRLKTVKPNFRRKTVC